MDGIEVMKGNEGKGRMVRSGDTRVCMCVGGVGVGGFHKALGSACVSLESKAFAAYHTSHKACMDDIGEPGNILQ